MADLEEDDTSSNAARQGVPAPSSLESARKASETSSLEPSSGVPSVSIEYGNPLIENTETAQRHESYYKEIPENLEDDMGEGIDTSWDQITPKFKEARHAMYNEHEAGVSEPYKTPSGVWGVAPSNASTTSIPSGGEIVQSKFAQALKTQSGPASSLESIQKQPTLQRREESRGAPKPPPLSLRQRAGRFTSNILSPFRSRKESQPADGFYLPKERSASMEALYEPEWSPTIEIISKAKAPISELWPDTTPAELYSPPAELYSPPPEGRETVDYFAASRTRRQGAPRTPIAELPGEDAISSLPKKNEDPKPFQKPPHSRSPSDNSLSTNIDEVLANKNASEAEPSTDAAKSEAEPGAPATAEEIARAKAGAQSGNTEHAEESTMHRRPSHTRGLSDTTIQSDSTAVSQPTPEELERWRRSEDDPNRPMSPA
jgi:hypothetical protein